MIDGVNYANVVALYLYGGSVGYWLKIIAFSFFFAARTEVTGREKGLLTFYSCRYKKRADYDYIMDRIVAIAGDRGDAAETREAFSATQIWSTLKGAPRAWRASGGYGAGPVQRLLAAALIAKFISTAQRSFRELVRGRTHVVTFSDAAPHDNLLAQLAMLGGAVTVTAQHGQYRVLDAANISVDAEAYANFISDRLLCWGEATCREFARVGIDRERMAITGWIRTWDRTRRPQTAATTFGVMLNGVTGAESNLALIDAANRLADELNMRFVVRLHPAFATTRYSALVNERCASIAVMGTGDYVRAVAFSIAHMSGATIEMLEVESPVYVLDDGRLAEAFQLPGLSFASVDELLAAVRADLATSDRGSNRTAQLRRWFNDDIDQDARILNAMVERR